MVLGDSVNRGRQSHALLWRLYQLSQQAQSAGGKLHFMLGNHEQYLLEGNFSRTEPEHLFAIEQIMPFAEAFSDQTVLGNWLRTRPVMVKIGPMLLTHAGISRTSLDLDLSMAEFNQLFYQRVMAGKSPRALDAFGVSGITHYRGYLRELPDHYPVADQQLIDQTLAHFDAEYIVVGHTTVPALTAKYQGKVYVIDNTAVTGETLYLENGRISSLTVSQLKQEFEDNKLSIRDFEPSNSSDWSMLLSFIASGVRLSLGT